MMKTEWYSVWLMPDAAWGLEFQAIVDDLASRFSTPRFQPHLTLIGGQPFDREDLKHRLASAVAGVARFSRPILDVVTGDAFFRSFIVAYGLKSFRSSFLLFVGCWGKGVLFVVCLRLVFWQ